MAKVKEITLLDSTPEIMHYPGSNFSMDPFSGRTIRDLKTNKDIAQTFSFDKIQIDALNTVQRELMRRNIYTDQDIFDQGKEKIEDLLWTALLSVALNEKIQKVRYSHLKLLIEYLGEWKGKRNIVTKLNTYDNTLSNIVAADPISIRKPAILELFITLAHTSHRLQKVAQVAGIEFINDSRATNRNSVRYALESIQKPIILITWWNSKDEIPEDIIPLMQDKLKWVVALGRNNSRIMKMFSNIRPVILDTQDMESAVKWAFTAADKGDVVLLSPGCASYDLFKNLEDRGEQFEVAVKNL